MDPAGNLHALAQTELRPSAERSDKSNAVKQLRSIRRAIVALRAEDLYKQQTQADLATLRQKLSHYPSNDPSLTARAERCLRAIDEMEGDINAFYDRMEAKYGADVVKEARSQFSQSTQEERNRGQVKLSPTDKGQFEFVCKGIVSTRRQNREHNLSFFNRLERTYSVEIVREVRHHLSHDQLQLIESGSHQIRKPERDALRQQCKTIQTREENRQYLEILREDFGSQEVARALESLLPPAERHKIETGSRAITNELYNWIEDECTRLKSKEPLPPPVEQPDRSHEPPR